MEKLKKMWKNKNKKMENLVAFLVILVITLIILNKIIKGDSKKEPKNYSNAELASTNAEDAMATDLETRLEKILAKIDGVGQVSVLITYSESSTIVPLYNENSKKSVTEETDTAGGTRTIESEELEKSVITGSNANPVTEKTVQPTIEGAIVIAEGASNGNIKANIVSAVEAVTGIATHKIQVFEMGGAAAEALRGSAP